MDVMLLFHLIYWKACFYDFGIFFQIALTSELTIMGELIGVTILTDATFREVKG